MAEVTKAPLLVLDCETFGLDPVINPPFEVAWCWAWADPATGQLRHGPVWSRWLSHTELDVDRAHPVALEMTRYHERCQQHPFTFTGPEGLFNRMQKSWIMDVPAGIDGTPHLVGMVPSFDDRRIGDFLERAGRRRLWHYHLIDLEVWAAGKLGLLPPYRSEDVSRLVGVDPDQYARHTAAGDVEWSLAVLEAVWPA